MTSSLIELGDITVNVRIDGTPSGRPVVFSNSLGTSLEVWDQVIARMPQNLRLIRYDTRGHGGTTVTRAPYKMGGLIRDVEQLLDHLEVRDCVFVGLSLGGMLGQGLATKRLDQIRALVLSNTAAKIGTAQNWQDRISDVKTNGLEAMSDAILERWLSKDFLKSPEAGKWRDMLISTPLEGYIGCCAAIAGTDFLTQTAGLGLSTLAIAGSEDKATPPDLVRETGALVKGSQFELIRGAGHLPCVEKPDEYAKLLTDFLGQIGHL